MTSFLGTGIFWKTLVGVFAILFLVTVIGRAWGAFFPRRFRAHAGFYLSPALGLASLTIIASVVGRFLPLGDSVIVPLAVVALLVFALLREQKPRFALRHAIVVSVFGILCGASVLGPLFAYGAFNAHNDAFTYLAHSNWLQTHAFTETISPEEVTPLTTQVSLYQQVGLRMGASFLLTLLQALLNLRWTYEVYPSVVIAAIAVCCLAIGFPLARALQPIRRGVRLALLALPATTLGGLVFGANLGFLPQTVGLAFGATLLFVAGPLFRWVAASNASQLANGKAAFPGAVLLTGAAFAYSELAPFVLMAVLGSGFILAYRFRAWRKVLVHSSVLIGLSILVLNTELLRAFAALRIQSSAVVGSPVDWSLLGFFAHALGVHGGASDAFQWTNPEGVGSISFSLGLLLLGLTIGVALAGMRGIWRSVSSGALLPAVVVLTIFASGVLYFRYFVPSPFPTGLGQSWSQFKLADWAHPFLMAFVLLAIAVFKFRLGKFFNAVVIALVAIGVVSATLSGVARATPLMQYYSGISDLNRFYIEFRETLFSTCPRSAPIYLALGGEHHKFRQMAALYLHDREVTSDWLDDGYIYGRLPAERRVQEMAAGNCVVESLGQDTWLSQGTEVGNYRIGTFDGQGQIRLVSMIGAYDRESDGQNWWHWVAHKVSFRLQPLFISKNVTQTKLRFEYGTRGKQTLILRVVRRDGSSQEVSLRSSGDTPTMFEKMIDVPPTELAELSIETDGKATPLGDRDTRMAAWIVRNVNITPVSP